MKPKEKPVLNGRSLFKFEGRRSDGSPTIPTTFTITITTTGFSRERPVQKEAVPPQKMQM